MYSKYNCFRLSTCLQVFALGALITVPAYAGFEWTPPDKPVPSTVLTDDSFIDDMDAKILIIDESDAFLLEAASDTSEKQSPPQENARINDINTQNTLDIEPPIEIKILEKSDYIADKNDPITVKVISEAIKTTSDIDKNKESEDRNIEKEKIEIVSPNNNDISNIVVEDIQASEDLAPEIEKLHELVLNPYPVKIEEIPTTAQPPVEHHQMQDVIDNLAITPTPDAPSDNISLYPYPVEEEIPAPVEKAPKENTIDEPVIKAESDKVEHQPETPSELVIESHPPKKSLAPPPPPISANAHDIQWNKTPPVYSVIEGFGKEMPMALALSQIVPPEFAYFFGKNVNPGARISWNGGKPWNKVLNEALAPLGVRAFINEKKIIIRSIQTPSVDHGDTTSTKENFSKEPEKPQKTVVAENIESPEKAMLIALEKKNDIIEQQEKEEIVEEAVILDKTTLQNNKSGENEEHSALVKDLMKPLNSFEPVNKITEGVKKETNNAPLNVTEVKNIPAKHPIILKPEIILDEQEKAEEDFARKLEETNPFNNMVQNQRFSDDVTAPPTIELIETPVTQSFDDDPEKSVAEPPPLDMSLDEELGKINTVLDVEEEKTISPSIAANVGAVEPSSNFREKPSDKIRVWQARSGANLQKIMEEWSAKERVALTWSATEEYELDYDVFISGTYKNAVNILFDKGLKKVPEYELSEAPYKISVQEEED